jgi:hypothetical protein
MPKYITYSNGVLLDMSKKTERGILMNKTIRPQKQISLAFHNIWQVEMSFENEFYVKHLENQEEQGI